MKRIKKIGKAVAGSALLIGATLAGAATMSAAQMNQTQNQTNQADGDFTLGDYPQPFVNDDGDVNSNIVIGADAKTIDVVGAVNIAGSLGNSAFRDTPVTGTGGVVGWDATEGVTLDTRNDPLLFSDQIDEVRETLTENDISDLNTTTFRDDAGDETDIEYFLYPGNQQITFGKPEDRDNEDPVLFVDNPSDVSSTDYLYQLQANFENDINFTSEDVEDEEIEFFGQTYTVSTDTTDNELVLFGSREEFDVETGESRTVTIDGEEHTIEVVSVTDSDTAAIRVDGQIRERDEDSTFTIGDQEVRIQDIIQTNADQSQGIVTFGIGTEELNLQAGQSIEDSDGDEYDGTYVEFNGGTPSNAVDELSSISIYIGANDTDREYVMAGESYNHPLFTNMVFHFGGLNPDAAEGGSDVGNYSVQTVGDDTVSVQFTGDGGDSATVQFAHTPDPEAGSPVLNLADDDDDAIHVIEGDAVQEDEYVVTDAGDFSHLWEVTNIDTDSETPSSGDEATVSLDDVVTGRSTDIDLDFDSGNLYTGSEVIDGQTYYFELDTQGGGGSSNDLLTSTWGDGSSAGDVGDSVATYASLDTESGASLALMEGVSNGQADTSTQTYELPTTESTDESEVNITVDYGATDEISATAVSGVSVTGDTDDNVTVQVNDGAEYLFVPDAGNTEVDISPLVDGSSVTDPTAGLIEPENSNDEENVYFTTPSVDTGDDEINVEDSTYTGQRATATLETDDDITAGYDIYGAYTQYDSSDQGDLNLNVPFSQSTAGAAFTGPGGNISTSTTVGGNATSVQPTGWPDSATLDTDSDIGQLKQDTNLILVGGPAVNDLTQELAQANKTQTREEYQQGQALIQLVENAFSQGNQALVVAGYAGEDTREASNYIANYQDHQDELAGQDQVTIDTGTGAAAQTEEENVTENQTELNETVNQTMNQTGNQTENQTMNQTGNETNQTS